MVLQGSAALTINRGSGVTGWGDQIKLRYGIDSLMHAEQWSDWDDTCCYHI